MVNFTFSLTINEMITISTTQTFRSWVVIFHLCKPMAFYLTSYTIQPGLLLVRMFYSEDRALFQSATKTGIPHGTLKIAIQEVLWSIRGSNLTTWSLPLTNVKWHSEPTPVTVTSQPIRLSTNFKTIIPSLTLTELRVVSMEHLQRMCHASRERFPFQTPGSVTLFGTCLCSNCWDQNFRTCHAFTRLFTLNTPRYILDFPLLNNAA